MRAATHFRPRPSARAGVVLVVNAHASGVTPELVGGIEAALRRWGAPHSTLVTESPHEWLDAVGDDRDRRIVLVGGDGTVHAVANASGVHPEVAIVPAGRANNVARSLGIPVAPEAAVRLALEGRARPIDLIEAETPSRSHVTVEAVSLGFLARARSRYHDTNSAHVASAVAAGVHALAEFHPFRAHLVTPTFSRELVVAQLFVANLPLYAFGLHVAPSADVTDGLLDIVAIEAQGRRGVPLMLHHLATARGDDSRSVHRWRAPSAWIDVAHDSPVIADSEDLGFGPLTVAARPDDLRVVRP